MKLTKKILKWTGIVGGGILGLVTYIFIHTPTGIMLFENIIQSLGIF